MATHLPPQRTLAAIIVYKCVRSGGAAVVGVTFLILALTGLAQRFDVYVQSVHDHAVNRLSLVVTAWVLSAVQASHFHVVIGALFLDSVVVAFEAWALWRGWWWGPWLVAAASGALVPFEVVAIVEHAGPVRVVVLVLNLAIVAYMLKLAWEHHRQRTGHAI